MGGLSDRDPMRRRTRLHLTTLLLGSIVLFTGSMAFAADDPQGRDTVEGTRFDVIEKAHAIDVSVERGHATLVVTRTVENPGPKSDQALFHLYIPDGAVATRLRTSGVNAKGETVWFEGELLEAEEAAKRYQELTGVGGYYPKDPALLSWRSQGHLALQVFPILSKQTKVVEYTLRVPLKYAEGTHQLELPVMGSPTVHPRIRVRSERPADRVTVNGVVVTAATTVNGGQPLKIQVTPEVRGAISGELASFGYAKDKHLVHAEINLAKRISEVPANASVVILIDSSFSMRGVTDSAVTAARAYLASFPGASVEVMTFARKVSSPFGGPLPSAEALSRLYGFQPTHANGSQLDEAVSVADAKLARSPAGAPRRLLVITDMEMRTALTPERFAARTISSGAIVHLATMGGSSASELVRDDDDAWAKLPRRTGGLFWHALAPTRVNDQTRAVFEEWVRPKRIDKVVVKGLPADAFAETTMKEGDGFEFLGLAGKTSSQVSLEGEVWSSPIRWSNAASADEGKKWAALAFGTHLVSQLSEKEMMTLAMHGRAVSPVTSYLAIEPGVRPSTEGLEYGEGGGGGGFGEGIGLGSIGTIGHGAGTSSVDHDAFLNKALGTAMRACQAPTGSSANAEVETTRIEVVDITGVTLAPKRDARVESCIAEHLWQNVQLPSTFTFPSKTWSVSAD